MSNSFVAGIAHDAMPVKQVNNTEKPGFRRGRYHRRMPVFRVHIIVKSHSLCEIRTFGGISS